MAHRFRRVRSSLAALEKQEEQGAHQARIAVGDNHGQGTGEHLNSRVSPTGLQEPLTPLVVFVMQGVSFCLHAVVQLHEQGLEASVHPLDQLMINHQGPQQDTEH